MIVAGKILPKVTKVFKTGRVSSLLRVAGWDVCGQSVARLCLFLIG